MYKRVDKLCLTDKVVLLGTIWQVEGIRLQLGNYDGADQAMLTLRDTKRGIEQNLNVTIWQEVEVQEEKTA